MIDSMTFSSGGQSATLDRDGIDRLHRLTNRLPAPQTSDHALQDAVRQKLREQLDELEDAFAMDLGD